MTFPYKAIFVDLDGTLLNSHKTISENNLNCLNSFIEQGIHVVVATGRTIRSVQKVLTSELNLTTPVITLNGSDIRSKIDGYSLSISYLDNAIRDNILEFCQYAIQEFHIKNILVDTGNSFYILDEHNIDREEFTNHYENPPQLLDLTKPFQEQVVSFLFLLSDDSCRKEFIESQKKLLPSDAKVCTFNGWPWIEIGSPKINKGAAMEFVCNLLGITCEDVIAFGDGENDVEMLERAGLGVAMANADEHARKAANVQTTSHDEDGVAYFLNQLHDINSNKNIFPQNSI